MLALCLMLSKNYYAQNYTGIIGLGLILGIHLAMLWAKYEFVQSMGCPLHKVAIDTFAQQIMDLSPNYNPWIVRSVPCAKYGLSRRSFVLF